MPALTTRVAERRRRRLIARLARRDTRPPEPEAFARFGSGSAFQPPARVSRPDCITIGDNVLFLEGCWLSVVEARHGHVPRLVIGDGCRFGRELSIACIGDVVIGPGVLTSDDVFIADCYHDYEDPYTPILRQPMSMPQPVEIGAGAYIGACSIILPGIRVGERAYVGEGAVVTADVPDRGVVFGNPARLVQVAAG